MKLNVLPADTYVVINKTVLSDQDRSILIMLYQPIVGSEAINLYFTLWSNLERNEIMSQECNHHQLMTNMKKKLSDIIESRERLEAIGLVKTYVKKGSINNYVYQIYSPCSASEFISNPILNTSLYNNVGKVEYEKIISYFKIPRINLTNYEEITSSFSDVFEVSRNSYVECENNSIKRRYSNQLKLNSKIDIDNIFALIPDELFNVRSLTKDVKDLIYKLAFIYNLNEDNLNELIRNSLSDKKTIDKDKLRINCRNFYQFENNGKLPSLIFRSQPEYLRKPVGDFSKRAKIIYTFETTTPYDFLYSKYHGTEPTKSDLKILEYLALDLDMKPGVINVLIDYVLRINDNKLTKSFIDTIAGQWKRKKIETVEEAMDIAEKEYKKRNKTQNVVVKTKVKEKPEWFDKTIEQKEASDDEISEIDALLGKYK